MESWARRTEHRKRRQHRMLTLQVNNWLDRLFLGYIEEL